MAYSDGALIIDGKMNNNALFKGAREFVNACKHMQTTVVNIGKAMGKAGDAYLRSISKQGQATRDANRSLDDMWKRYKQVVREMNEIQKTGGSKSAYDKLSEEAKSLSAEMQKLRGAKQDLGGVDSGFARIAQSARQAGQSIVGMIAGGAWGFLKKLAAGAKNAAIALAKLAGRAVVSGLRKIGQYAGQAAKKIFGLGRSAKQSGNGFQFSLKNLLRYGLGIRSLFALFNRLRRAIKEGFETMAKYNPQLKSALTSLSASLNGLKGSLASAFAPILTAIAPALTTLINLLTQAINAIGMFFAALTGQAFYAAKGVAAVGSAAGKASGSAKELKRQLAGFDELNILSANSGGGGGGGGGSGAGYTYSQMPISEGIKNFVDEVKRLFAAGEYEEIGRIIGDGINKAIAKAKDFIKWENIGPVITKYIKLVAGIINGIADEVNFSEIGATLAAGFNTVVNALRVWFLSIRWRKLGQDIAAAINGFFDGEDGVDWDALGKLVYDKGKAVVDMLAAAVTDIEWGNAGTELAKAVNSFFQNPALWVWAGYTVDRAIKGIFEWTDNFLEKFDAKQAAADIKAFFAQIDWPGIATEIWNTAKLAIGNLNEFIGELFSPNKGAGGMLKGINDIIRGGGSNSAIENAGSEFGDGFAARIAVALSDAAIWILDAITWAIGQIDWGDVGDSIHEMLVNLEWVDIFDSIGDALVAAANGLGRTLIAAMFGKDSAVYKWIFGEDDTGDVMKLVSSGAAAGDIIERARQRGDKNVLAGAASGILTRGALEKAGLIKSGDTNVIGLDGKRYGIYKIPEMLEKIKKPIETTAEVLKGMQGTGNNTLLGKLGSAMFADNIGWKLAAGFAKQTVDVGVDYTPDGVGGAIYKNRPLEWLKSALKPGATLDVQSRLTGASGDSKTPAGIYGTVLSIFARLSGKDAQSKTLPAIFGSVTDFFGRLTGKSSDSKPAGTVFGTIADFLARMTGKTGDSKTPALIYGTVVNVLSNLTGKQSGTKSVADVYGTTLKVTAELIKKPNNKISWTAYNKNGNTVELMKSGGVISAAGNVLRFAAGGSITGGRANWWNSIQKYATGSARAHGTLFAAGEAGPEVIGHIGGRTEILNKSQLAQTMYNAVTAGMIAAMNAITFRMPAMATGSVMPYEVSAQIAQSTDRLQHTLDANNEDLIQTIISVASQIVAAMNNRPAQQSASGMTAQQVINEINRRTQMFSASPLKGV